jgi:hypothetical protein
MEDLERYLEKIVEPTVKDFEEHPTSVRHAFLACVAVFHGVDYLAYPRKRLGNLRQEFGNQSPDFLLVDRVAHAFKHVITGPRQNPHLKADEVISRPAGLSGDCVSIFNVLEAGVVVSNDHNVVLLDTVKRATEFLWKQTKTPIKHNAPLAAQSPRRQSRE